MLKTIRPEAMTDNIFKLIGKDTALLTACNAEYIPDGQIKYGRTNSMTVSWGSFGQLWNKSVCTIYVRPSRYTKEILDETDTFTLSFLDPNKYKTALTYMGQHSGRDGDKYRPSKVSVNYQNGMAYIKEARLVMFCRKIYAQEFNPDCFVNELVCKSNYKKDDFHTMYIAEIEKIIEDIRK